MTDGRSDLIRELLALYARHGSAEFRSAIAELRRGDVIRSIIDTSTELALALEKHGSRVRDDAQRPTKRSRKSISVDEAASAFISSMRQTGDERQRQVAELLSRIAKRTIFSSDRSLKQFVAQIGMPVREGAMSRPDIIREIGDYLVSLEREDALSKIDMATRDNSTKSALQGWANIIVKDD